MKMILLIAAVAVLGAGGYYMYVQSEADVAVDAAATQPVEDTAKEQTEEVTQAVEETVNTLTEDAQTAAEEVENALDQAADQAEQAATDAVDNATDSLSGAAQEAGDALNQAADDLKDLGNSLQQGLTGQSNTSN